MNKIYHKWLTRGFMTLAGVIGMQSCSDDHFDIHSDVSGRSTVWQNISSQADLTEFADILSSVYVSKSKGSTTPQTYADLLSHDQTFTVWAPANGTFDYATWKALLDEGGTDNTYKVENELIRNNMSRYSHLLSGSDSTLLELFNDKSAMFNCAQGTIRGQHITTSNIASSNGVLHITDGPVAYLPNIYEYLTSGTGLDSINSFIKSFEKYEFDEDASTQGPTIDGNISWVDSVTYLSNDYLDYNTYMGAKLNSEDSLYAVVIPSNTAWQKAYEQVKPYFNYMQEYQQTVTVSSGEGAETSETHSTTFTDAEFDSLTHFNISNVIARDLAFNTTSQFGHSYADYSQEGACDSLISTHGTVFYDPYSARLFDGQTPIELSNGYAYVVDNFNYRAQDAWATPREISPFRVLTYDYCTPTVKKIDLTYTSFTDSLGNTTPLDTIISQQVLALDPERSTANTAVTFPLRNTLSCKYDIYAVMAYNYEAARPYQFRAYLTYHRNRSTTSREQLTPIEGVNGTGKYFVTKTPHIDENGNFQYNDSVLLAEDFELPVCYYGLDDFYVTLEIQSYMTSRQRNLYTNELYIAKIVLVPKVEEEE